MVNIEALKNIYYVNMIDVPYNLKKSGTVYIKPILLKDYQTYEWAKQCLLLNKNEINDIEIIQMSYLEYLIKIVFKQDEEYEQMVRCILHLSLGDDYVAFGDNCVIICEEDRTIKQVISSKEFDEISKIILSQNDINYDDRYVNPEVREVVEQYYKIKYRDTVAPSLEKRKAFVSSKVGKSFSELNMIPYREFDLLYEACKDSEMYIGHKIIQGSYKYDVKDDVVHPLFEKKRDMYAEAFEDTSVLANKGISGADQLNALNVKQMLDSK